MRISDWSSDVCSSDLQQARALDGPGGTIFDSFQVLPGDTRQPTSVAAIERRLTEALSAPLERIHPARPTQPRPLPHFRIVPRLQFDARAQSGPPVPPRVCTSLPALLPPLQPALRKRRMSAPATPPARLRHAERT